MKRKIILAVISLFVVLCISGCKGEEALPPENGEQSNAVTDDGTPENGGDEYLTLTTSDKKTEYALIRQGQTTMDYLDTVQNFVNAFEEKTGVNLKLYTYPESTAEVSKEIIIGDVGSREVSAAAMSNLSYSGCKVMTAGEKIIVSAYSDIMLDDALTRLVNGVEQNGNGDWILKKDFAYENDGSGATLAVPHYNTAKGNIEGIYNCGEKNYSVSVSGTDAAEYTEYIRQLKEKGYNIYKENKIGNADTGENLFGTYVSADGQSAAYTAFYPNIGTAKVIWGARGYLPSAEAIPYPEAGSAKVTPSITQIGRDGVWSGYNSTTKTVNGAPGMSYVIQLADGRFIIIDGGNADSETMTLSKVGGEWTENESKMTEDTANLLKFLQEKSEGITEKPVIAAWIITHAHGDHMGLVNNFIKTYGKDVVIEMAAYNFPDFNTTALDDGTTLSAARYVSEFKGALYTLPTSNQLKRFIFHSGQELHFAGCEIEFLYTHEDYYPSSFATGNHTSCAFRVIMKNASGEDTVFTVLGDAEAPLCKEIAEIYGAELKSDILQLSHHGFNGGCLELYKYIDPDICFWACDPYRFETDKRCLGTRTGYDFNAWIRDDTVNAETGTRPREHYCSDVTTTITVK